MNTPETAVGTPEVKHASAEELEKLLAVCEEQLPWLGRRTPVVDQYLDDMHHARLNPHEPIIYDEHADQALERPALRQLMKFLYPDATEEDLRRLVQIDGTSLAELDAARLDPRFAGHEWDWKDAKPYIYGAPEGIHGFAYRPYPERFKVSELVEGRIKEGMPRNLQLIAVARELEPVEGELHDRLTYTHHIIRLFDINEEEFRAVYRLRALINPHSQKKFTTQVLSDPSLLTAYMSEQDGAVDVEGLGGEEMLNHVLQGCFMEQASWQACVQTVPNHLLDTLLPLEQRCELVAASIAEKPRQPEGHWLPYIAPRTVAQAAHSKTLEMLATAPEYRIPWNLTRAQVAERFGRDPQPFVLKTLDARYHYIALIEQYADPDSNILLEGKQFRRAIESIDPELEKLLTEYVAEFSIAAEPWPTQGWSGAPEEGELVEQMSAERASANKALNELERRITQLGSKQ